jgi:hypothetical protein
MGRPQFATPVERPADRAGREGNLTGQGANSATTIPSDNTWTDAFRVGFPSFADFFKVAQWTWTFRGPAPGATADFELQPFVYNTSIDDFDLQVFADHARSPYEPPAPVGIFPDEYEVGVRAKNNTGTPYDMLAGHWVFPEDR